MYLESGPLEILKITVFQVICKLLTELRAQGSLATHSRYQYRELALHVNLVSYSSLQCRQDDLALL